MKKISPNDLCPCFSHKKYKKCCRLYHNGMKIPTPESLVRARYAAYSMGLADFIMLTTHPDNPNFDENKDTWRANIDAFTMRSMFYKLDILSAEDDKVSYRATTLSQGKYNTVMEHCTFKQVDGKWLYLDGIHETETEDAEEIDKK